MNSKSNPSKSSSMPISARKMVLYPFQIIFYGICSIMNWLLKPSALRHENGNLRAKIDSQKEEINMKMCKNEELRKLNSDMDAKVMAFQLKKGKMKDVLDQLERKAAEGNEKIDSQTECIERLEMRLQITKKMNKELGARFKNLKLLMESSRSKWKLRIDELGKENLSMEASMRKHSGVIERQKRNVMALEMGIGQLQAISTALESEKEEMKKHCIRLEEENQVLKDFINHAK